MEDGKVGFPLRVGETGLWLREVRGERRQARAEVRVRREQRRHGGFFRHRSGGLADQVNNGVAMTDVGVQLFKRGPPRDSKILLHGDIKVGAFLVAGHWSPFRNRRQICGLKQHPAD